MLNLEIVAERPLIDDTLAKAEKIGYARALSDVIEALSSRKDCIRALSIVKCKARTEIMKGR